MKPATRYPRPATDIYANRQRWAPLGQGKTVVVTGANSGLGFFASLGLARAGAQVILACRNQSRAEHAMEQIRLRVPAASVEFMQFDSSRMESAMGLAAELRNRPLDALIANAGVIRAPQSRVEGLLGHELTMSTNFIGHARLVGELAERFAQPLRFIGLGSMSTRMLATDPQNLALTRDYHPYRAYAQSKAAVQAFTLALDHRLRQLDLPARALAIHPGYSLSGLTPQVPNINEPDFAKRLIGQLQSSFAQGKHEGAVGLVEAALAPELEDAPRGSYLGPKYLTKGPTALASPAKATRGKELQSKAWELFVEANEGLDPFAL
ncbi:MULTISPECIES: SDR family NAD(P)-dependent oxidoreductase [Actinomycetes]|uniref:SDR family NAD(P)-dependent oxidoreductase n=1 Tax=Actinomycetes TaxID=1760 RepID=UPI00344078A6